MGRVDHKVALVTGAAQGIGAATARLLAKEGAMVVLSDINIEGANDVAREINSRQPECAIAIEHDVSDEAAWQSALGAVRQRFNGLHVLVNNAGIAAMGNIEDESYENWRRVHLINLDSVFLGCKYALPLMSDSGGGSIVNVSSISGIIAGHNLAAYNSAKAAVRHLSKSVALHCARVGNSVRCNSVHPAFIDTPILDGLNDANDTETMRRKLGQQIPIGHIGEPDDVAFAILYLASDEAKFVTGSEIKIDGGISAM